MPKKYLGKSPEQIQAEIKTKLSQLPLRIANLGLEHFKENFDTGSWEGEKWVPRKDRLNHPLLQKTRTLYRSLKKEVQANSIRVFIAAPADIYGAAHNEGFTGTVNVNYKSGRRSQRNMNLPQRKFIGPSDKMDKKADDLVVNTINEILKG